jgi:KaiC/GvpD/RAD55 family RecA-like ATPase
MMNDERARVGAEILDREHKAALQAHAADPSKSNAEWVAKFEALAVPSDAPTRESLSPVDAAPVQVARGAKTSIPPVADAASLQFERFRQRLTKEHQPVPIPWPSIKAPFNGGLWPGVHIIAGGTGAGKTAFALQWALYAAQQGVPALYVGLEMTEADIVARLASLLCQVEPGRILAGAYHARPLAMAEFESIASEVCSQLAQLPAFRYRVASAHAWDYGLLAEDAEALRRETGYTGGAILLVLDFLQIVASPPGAREDLRERISKAAYMARAAAGASQVACLMVSSAARERIKVLQKWANGWPEYSVEVARPKKGEDEGESVDCTDFIGIGKESGDIEYSAETLTILAPIDGNSKPQKAISDRLPDIGCDSRVRLGWPKVRYGPRGATSTLIFNGYRWRDDPDGQALEQSAWAAPRTIPPPNDSPSASVMRKAGAGLAARAGADKGWQGDLEEVASGVASEGEPRPSKRGRR